MTPLPTTLHALAEALPQVDLPVGIDLPAGAMGQAFHVTEIKHAHTRSLDCGRGTHRWDEITVQLLDGQQGRPLTASRLGKILRAAVFELGQTSDATLYFEASQNNAGLEKLALQAISQTDAQVTLTLAAVAPTCKPSATFEQVSSCCS